MAISASELSQLSGDRPIITFLSDYGLEGAFVGACHGVMIRSCADVRIVDITHGIPRHDIRAGALALRDALPYTPRGVHLAVVDPEVGRERLAIAVRAADGQLFVGPDTGMLCPAIARLGGIIEAVDIGESPYVLKPMSATFHGRDIFSPVAARLASGGALTDVGRTIDPSILVQYKLPGASMKDGALVARVLTIDRFGNAVLNIDREELAQTDLSHGATVEVSNDGSRRLARIASTFADVDIGEPLLYVDAQQMLALAVNRGSAARDLGLGVDSEVRLLPIDH